MTSYRVAYIEKLVQALRDIPEIVALWEGGSAATATTDQYSDIDLMALSTCDTDEAFAFIESVMPPITHRYVEPAGPDLRHRIYFHDDAPTHFFADVGVLSEHSRATLGERMVIERHGTPIVYFDHKGLVKPQPIDKTQWRAKLETRLKELEDSSPFIFYKCSSPWIAITILKRLPVFIMVYCAD